MNDSADFFNRDFEPGQFDATERQLRTALAQESAKVTPRDRLDAILVESSAAGLATTRPRRGVWGRVVPFAAAAAVASVIGGIWWSGESNNQTREPVRPATVAPPVTGPTPTASSPAATDTQASNATRGTTSVSLPVYFVGPTGDDRNTYKLIREFLRSELPIKASLQDKAEAALRLAIDAQPYTNTDGYLQPWSGQLIEDVIVNPDLITINLANAGNPDAAATAEVRRLAVQELVWAVQAATQSSAAVRITVEGRSVPLFGSIPTDRTFTRPPPERLYEDVAPIWITTPGRDESLPAGLPIVATGLAVAHEASLNWQLLAGAKQVAMGHVNTSIGAPMQGRYSIALGDLPAGAYTLRVFAMSMEDGDKVSAERRSSFIVK